MHLQLIIGPTKAGKTTTLYSLYQTKGGLFFQHYFSDDTLTDAIKVVRLSEIQAYAENVQRIFIDDFHRFTLEDARRLYVELVLAGKEVYIAGRNTNHFGYPYLPIIFLSSVADEVILKKGVCYIDGCQNPAIYTARMINDIITFDEQNRVAFTSEIKEIALCRHHFKELIIDKRRYLHDKLYSHGDEYDTFGFFEVFENK